MGHSLVGSTSTSSLLAASTRPPISVGVILLAVLSGRIRPLVLLEVGVAVSTVGLFVIGIATTMTTVIFGLVVAAVGAAFTYVPAFGFVGASVNEKKAPWAIGIASAGVGLGIVVARLLVIIFGAESNLSGWRDVWKI